MPVALREVGTIWCLTCLALIYRHYSLSRRIEAETTVPVSSVLVDELPPHVADVGADDESIPPLDELWNIKRRLDLVRSAISWQECIMTELLPSRAKHFRPPIAEYGKR